jgi:hypothetical protein
LKKVRYPKVSDAFLSASKNVEPCKEIIYTKSFKGGCPGKKRYFRTFSQPVKMRSPGWF